jgi:hypothetical protein
MIPTTICQYCNHDPHPQRGCDGCGGDGPCQPILPYTTARTITPGRELAAMRHI